MQHLKLRLEIEGKYFWSDFTITLGWIRHYLQIVAHRIGGIQNISCASKWSHISSIHNNPADIISRGCVASQIVTSELW